MKQRLIYFLKYYVFWLAIMLLQKPLFMLSQYAQLGDIQALDWLRVIAHAFPLDLSVASYIMVLFGLLLTASFFAPARIIARSAKPAWRIRAIADSIRTNRSY